MRPIIAALIAVTFGLLACVSAETHGAWIDDWSYVQPSAPFHFTVKRLADSPIIHPGLSTSIGTNINGPSLIRVPDWVENPLGDYYLYFAHHNGSHIRMAYANSLTGPWTVHDPGVLSLNEAFGVNHIASPDIHIDHQQQRIRMYYHQPAPVDSGHSGQVTWAALSSNGLSFQPQQEILGRFYFRVFERNGWHYTLAKYNGSSAILYRSQDGLTNFEEGPRVLPEARHMAIWEHGENVYVFFSRSGDAPEHILVSRIENPDDDWQDWRFSEPHSVLAPEFDYEGVNEPILPSVDGASSRPVHQLRDPAIFEEDGRVYLLYSTAGERGIAIAEITLVPEPATGVLCSTAFLVLLARRRCSFGSNAIVPI